MATTYPVNDFTGGTLESFRLHVEEIKSALNEISHDNGSGNFGLFRFGQITNSGGTGSAAITPTSIAGSYGGTDLTLIEGTGITLTFNDTTKSIQIDASAASISVEDTPTDGHTTTAISSNWAHDHAVGETVNLHTKLGVMTANVNMNDYVIQNVNKIRLQDFDDDATTEKAFIIRRNACVQVYNGNILAGNIGSSNKAFLDTWNASYGRVITTGGLIFPDSTTPAHYIEVVQATVTANRTLTLPDSTGTLATQEWVNSNAVVSSRTISTGNGLQGGGDLSANRTLSVVYSGSGGNYGTATSVARSDHIHNWSSLDVDKVDGIDIWTGTEAEYTALGTYNSSTLYVITAA